MKPGTPKPTPEPADVPLLTVNEAAAYLGDIGRVTVYELIRTGEIKAVVETPGGPMRFRPRDLDEYLRSCAVEMEAKTPPTEH